jgi:hypothetical protein
MSVEVDASDKRKLEFQHWITDFLHANGNDTFEVIDNAAEILNSIYWHLLDTYVRPIVSGNSLKNGDEGKLINRFKIISTTEFTIINALPFVEKKSEDEQHDSKTFEENEAVRKVNAEFAWYVSIVILSSWKSHSTGANYTKEQLEAVYNVKDQFSESTEISTIKEEHINWLTYLDRESSFPVFSNSQFWRIFELCIQ